MSTVLILCCLVIPADPVLASGVHVGGSENTTRIIFDMKEGVAPDVVQKNQTLIVNFPYTIGDPLEFHELSMIQQLVFDGTKAIISVKTPFTYKTSTGQSPPRLVIDLFAQGLHKEPCPMKSIEISAGKDLISVAIYLGREIFHEVRSTKDGRVYIYFSGTITCEGLEGLLAPIAQLKYTRVIRMASGSVVCLKVAQDYKLLKTTTDRRSGKIIIEIKSPALSNGETRYECAQSLYAAGNASGVISFLEKGGASLTTKEKILLGRAYWAKAFPYTMGSWASKATATMSAAIAQMQPGMERDGVILEYCSMLVLSGASEEAMKKIPVLKESGENDISIAASILEVAVLNYKGLYQDAYAANKRLTRDSGKNGIPSRLKAFHMAVLGDTYLGLNDFSRALDLYKQAIEIQSSIVKVWPGIFSGMGEAAFKLYDFAQAKAYLMQAINLGDPANRPKYLIMLGDSLYQLGEKDKAIIVLAQVETIAPGGDDVVIAKLKLARILIEKNTDEHGRISTKTLNEVLDIYEGLKTAEGFKDKSLASLVKVRIAQAYTKHGDWEKALEVYNNIYLETKPADTIHHYVQIEAMKTINEHIRVLYKDSHYGLIYGIYLKYQKTFMKDTIDGGTLFIIGDTLYRLGQMTNAREILASSMKGETSNDYKEQTLTLLFTIDVKRRSYQEALLWNTIYLSSFPAGKDAQFMKDKRGEVLYELGSLKEALPYLEASANSDRPLALSSLGHLADVYQRLFMTQQQEQTLERIISYCGKRNSPIIEDALYLRANQLKKAHDLANAQSNYQKLLDAYPRSSHAQWARYHLAQIAYALGDQSEARTLLTNIQRISKDPVLLSAARAEADNMELHKELEGFVGIKHLVRSE